MHAYEVVGHVNTELCLRLCTDCGDTVDGAPIFAEEDGWEEYVCDECGEYLGDVRGVVWRAEPAAEADLPATT